MYKLDLPMFRTPFSPAYWKQAGREMKSLKMLVFTALMAAAAWALGFVPSIPVGHTKFSVGFLARSLCALVCGPVLGMAYGFVEDIVGYLLNPSGLFFFGYTISTMAGMLVYALCFYRAKITVWRIVLANVLVNVLVNATMGSLWSAMMAGVLESGGYWALFTVSLGKNLVTIIPKTVMIYIVFQAALPILQRMLLIPKQVDGVIKPF